MKVYATRIRRVHEPGLSDPQNECWCEIRTQPRGKGNKIATAIIRRDGYHLLCSFSGGFIGLELAQAILDKLKSLRF